LDAVLVLLTDILVAKFVIDEVCADPIATVFAVVLDEFSFNAELCIVVRVVDDPIFTSFDPKPEGNG
jgi:hypothetical protein